MEQLPAGGDAFKRAVVDPAEAAGDRRSRLPDFRIRSIQVSGVTRVRSGSWVTGRSVPQAPYPRRQSRIWGDLPVQGRILEGMGGERPVKPMKFHKTTSASVIQHMISWAGAVVITLVSISRATAVQAERSRPLPTHMQRTLGKEKSAKM